MSGRHSFGLDFHTLHRNLDSGNYHPISRIQTALHQDAIRLIAQYAHAANVQTVFSIDQQRFTRGVHGASRQYEYIGLFSSLNFSFHEQSGHERRLIRLNGIRVFYLGHGVEKAGFLIQSPFGTDDAAFPVPESTRKFRA